MCLCTSFNHVIEVTVAFSIRKPLTMIRGSKHVYGYNFNNCNEATIKCGFSVHQLVCNLI
jgi:hypothetical protein